MHLSPLFCPATAALLLLALWLLAWTFEVTWQDFSDFMIGDASTRGSDFAMSDKIFSIAVIAALLQLYNNYGQSPDASHPNLPTVMDGKSKVEAAPDLPQKVVNPTPPLEPRKRVEFRPFRTADCFSAGFTGPKFRLPDSWSPSHHSRSLAPRCSRVDQPDEVQSIIPHASDTSSPVEISEPAPEPRQATPLPVEQVSVSLPDYLAAVAPPTFEAIPAPAPQPPSLEEVYQVLAMKAGELQINLCDFLTKVRCFGSVAAETAAVTLLLTEAWEELWPRKNQLTSEDASRFGWAQLINEFWILVQPHGYILSSHYGDEMKTVLDGIAGFGQYLGLHMQDLDMTPPRPPSPPQMGLPPSPLPMPAQIVQQTSTLGANTNNVPATWNTGLNSPGGTLHKHVRQRKTAVPRRNPTQQPQLPPKSIAQVLAHAPASEKTSAIDLKGLSFEDDAYWAQKDEEELAEMTHNDFGWAEGDEETNRKIWNFSTIHDLKLSGSALEWQDVAFVGAQLNKVAPAFKRATFMLIQQARIGNRDKYTPSAYLINDLMGLLGDAEKMTLACGGTSETQG
ncbi:hypothetical protein ACEQ8H_003620 [Pleosporales sp. CAS-2024a]